MTDPERQDTEPRHATPPGGPPRGRRGPLSLLTGALAEAAVRGVDLDAAVGEVDLDRQLGRIDVNRLLARIDVNALLDRVDVDRLLEHVDVNRLLDRADPDRLLERVDIEALVKRAGIAEIVADSTSQVAGGIFDVVRRQVVAVDLIVMRVLYRLTGRAFDKLPAGPAALVAETDDPVLRPAEVGAPVEMVGRYAGLLPRLLALVLDLALSTSLLTLGTAGLTWVLQGIFGLDIQGGAASGAAFGVALAAWWLLYWTATLSVGGRTPGMGAVGLRLLRDDGQPLSLSRVAVWTLVLPISTIFGIGYALALVGSRRQTLHDRAASASLVYDWGRRGTGADTPLARWIQERGEG